MKHNDPISVLIIDGESNLAPGVFRCLASAPEIELHILSANLDSGFRYSRHVKSLTIWLPSEGNDLQAAISDAVRKTGAHLLVACSAAGTEFLLRKGQAFPNVTVMPISSLESFQSAADKWKFYLTLVECKSLSPRTWLCDSEWPEEEVCFPVLLKPRIGEGGVGIRRIETATDLRTFIASAGTRSSSYIIQEFEDGWDIDCSVLCNNGEIVAWTVQQPLRFGKEIFAPAFAVEFTSNGGVLAEARRIVAHLRWHGVAHFDMRMCTRDGALRVIEMNPRFWDSIHGSAKAGVNFPHLTCLMATNRPFDPPMGSTVRYVKGKAGMWLWLKGYASDMGSRLWDPLPDILGPASRLTKRLASK